MHGTTVKTPLSCSVTCLPGVVLYVCACYTRQNISIASALCYQQAAVGTQHPMPLQRRVLSTQVCWLRYVQLALPERVTADSAIAREVLYALALPRNHSALLACKRYARHTSTGAGTWCISPTNSLTHSQALQPMQGLGRLKKSPPTISILGLNPLNPELNPICYLLVLLAHHFLYVSRIRVKSLTLRLLMSYIYGAPILDVSRSHTTTQHSR